MNTQIIHITPHPIVTFENWGRLKNVAEQVQKELRHLYHNAHADGASESNNFATRFASAKKAIAEIFADSKCPEKISLGSKIKLKLKSLYDIAFLDGRNGTGAGWANATVIRRQIAELLEKDGFKTIAEGLRMNIFDNLPGSY